MRVLHSDDADVDSSGNILLMVLQAHEHGFGIPSEMESPLVLAVEKRIQQ